MFMNDTGTVTAKLVINGKEIEVMINPDELSGIIFKKETGYERVDKYKSYFYESSDGTIGECTEENTSVSQDDYDAANYYSNYTVAENNARADKLIRQLRRFAVEHRKLDLDWCNSKQKKYYILYDHQCDHVFIQEGTYVHNIGAVYFDSKDSVKLAIETFHDELVWYFTEYKDSL